MRILFINDHTGLGGKEKYLARLRKGLREAGHVTGFVYSIADGGGPDEHEISFCVPGIDASRNSKPMRLRLKECLTLFKPDVIHIHHNSMDVGTVKWLAQQVPTMRSVHDVEFLCPTRYYVRKDTKLPCDAACGTVCFAAGCVSALRPRSVLQLLKTRFRQSTYGRITALNTQSQYMSMNLARVARTSRTINVLPVFTPKVETPAPYQSSARFLFVGRLNRWKGPHIAIEALIHLAPEATLEIVGSGNMEKELKELVRKLNLDNRVCFAGHVGGSELMNCYGSAAAVVVPSVMAENCPLSVQEAMACARPVIASRSGGVPELVEDGVTGYLVRPNDAGALAEAMNRVLENSERSRKLGENGRQKIMAERFQEAFHVRTMVREYERLAEFA